MGHQDEAHQPLADGGDGAVVGFAVGDAALLEQALDGVGLVDAGAALEEAVEQLGLEVAVAQHAGQAALVVVGHDEYAERIPLSMERATARTDKALRVDKDAFEQALREASQELGREQKAADAPA